MHISKIHKNYPIAHKNYDKNLENNRRKVIRNKFCIYKPTIVGHVTNPNSNVLGNSSKAPRLKKIFLAKKPKKPHL